MLEWTTKSIPESILIREEDLKALKSALDNFSKGLAGWLKAFVDGHKKESIKAIKEAADKQVRRIKEAEKHTCLSNLAAIIFSFVIIGLLTAFIVISVFNALIWHLPLLTRCLWIGGSIAFGPVVISGILSRYKYYKGT